MLFMSDAQAVDTKFTLEIRERYERRLNKDFLTSAADNRSDLYSRFRPTLETKFGKNGTFVLQYQFSYDAARTPAKKFSTENQDVNQAYLKIAVPNGSFTAGRQKINIGSERLIGSLEWVNVPRSYDGFRFQQGAFDVFAAKVGVAMPKPENAEIVGLTYKSDLGQTLAVYKNDESASGKTHIWTIDHSNKLTFGNTDFDYDIAAQGGKVTGKDHSAWAAHGAVTFRKSKTQRAYVELNAASGGHSATKSETFDNLYPTNHKFYGSMDMQGWKNMVEFAAGWQQSLNAKTDLHLHAHLFRLMDAKDAWYGAGGAPNKGPSGVYKDATGASGKEVGTELDLEFAYRHDATTTLNFGIGSFNPGKFIKAKNGGSADSQTWFFLMLSKKM